MYNLGIDIGSTTIKAVLLDRKHNLVFSIYNRHHGKIIESIIQVVNELDSSIKNIEYSVMITGSVGMGICERFGIPFVQELIASSEYFSKKQPKVRTIIDIGGEDSKIIFLKQNGAHDIRMNSSCAGGTGAFIDQMASILNLTLPEMDILASDSENEYHIASRCGVFAKTDVQNLISRNVPKADICATIFKAVAIQIKNTLLRGSDLKENIALTGGPLTFLDNLRKSVIEIFDIDLNFVESIEHSELTSAIGAALCVTDKNLVTSSKGFIRKLTDLNTQRIENYKRLEPLFDNESFFNNWNIEHNSTKAKRIALADLISNDVYIGIDSGSTTTKIVITDKDLNICFEYYVNNLGDPIARVYEGLNEFSSICRKEEFTPVIKGIVSTGYGEELIKAAFSCDDSIVETIAHFKAARYYIPEVSFILDIGGQDMKAIFINDGIIDNIEINEACSSGCGSFIETFANSQNLTREDFARCGVISDAPCDLGSRCTVFMNSKVKQAFREGAESSDISAGLAYSVVNNCLTKVLKIHDMDILGDNIVVQGGTFKNPSVLRAFEKITGKKPLRPDIAHLMGAFGASLAASELNNVKGRSLSELLDNNHHDIKIINCSGCENLCNVSKITFSNGKSYFTGNRCEKIFTNSGDEAVTPGFNMPSHINDAVFDRELNSKQDKTLGKIGIPRVLNIFENFPFWASLLTKCGFDIVLSGKSSERLCNLGAGTVMSDNICFPAKLTHGHIVDLINKEVDRIFYPMVVYEELEYQEMNNSYNCPVVTGYPDVIKNSIRVKNIEIDTPAINFSNKRMLRKSLIRYLHSLGVRRRVIKRSLKEALREYSEHKLALKTKGMSALKDAIESDKITFIYAGRPYHNDDLINHKTPELIAQLGYDVISAECLALEDENIEDIQILTQWSYPNRLYKAARLVANNKNLHFLQMNSFGCGPDAITIEETKSILTHSGKNCNIIRVDEHTASGSLVLRIRSLIESIKMKEERKQLKRNRITTPPFEMEDKKRTILVPYFSPFHSFALKAGFNAMGYNLTILPPPDQSSIDMGLKYVNNEICYPATLVIGDIIRSLKTGEFNTDDIAIGISQTGGQCRATSYLSLLRKALVNSGFHDVPVVSVSMNHLGFNPQPGFEVDRKKLLWIGLLGITYGDCISRLYHASAAREKNRGESLDIANTAMDNVYESLVNSSMKGVLENLSEVVKKFNQVKTIRDRVPKIGVVGEVYVKYNPFGNVHLVERIVDEGIEVILPPLLNMFIQNFHNTKISYENFIEGSFLSTKIDSIKEFAVERVLGVFENKIKEYKYYSPTHKINHIANKASGVLNLVNHYFGEGWLISGDIASFAEDGVNDVLCLQPFGCIANHIVARGAERRLREKYPDLNLVYLDIDSGVSDVNLLNRIHLLLKRAKTLAK